MATAAPNVLVVGDIEKLDPIIAARLQRSDIHPVWQTTDVEAAYRVAARHRPRFVVLDFELPNAESDVVADALRGLTPTAWIMDFRGVLRRRPDQAGVALERTEPLFVTID